MRRRLTDVREDPIAADARPHGDGRELAKQKVVAGLLGVGLDEILRRAERARKQRNLIRVGAGSAAALVVIAAAVGWTAGLSVTSRLTSAENLNYERDAADLCEDAGGVIAMYNFSDADRISLAFECVSTLSLAFDGSPQDARLPPRLISMLETNLAVLRKYGDAGELTSEQSDTLNKAETLAAHLDRY